MIDIYLREYLIVSVRNYLKEWTILKISLKILLKRKIVKPIIVTVTYLYLFMFIIYAFAICNSTAILVKKYLFM